MKVNDYFAIGRKGLEAYHDHYYPYDQDQVIDLEMRVSFALDPDGAHRMMGFVDRLSRDRDGRLRIHDYKTGGTLPGQPEVDLDAQLALYQIAVMEKWPRNNGIELVWHYLQFDAELISTRTAAQLEELRQAYIAKIRRIEAATALGNFPTHESSLCRWCEYFALCPAKGGSGAAAGAQIDLHRPSPAEQTALVDEYIQLDRRIKEGEKRQNEIRGLLVRLCETGSSTRLDGSDGEALMFTLAAFLKLPGKSVDTEAYETIVRIVKDAGLYDIFSSLDMAALQKALTAGDLPAEVGKQLAPFQIETVSDRLRIVKGKAN
jgi:CRISPR/Cas system-associated exonuclease Cas4 (RecB family)